MLSIRDFILREMVPWLALFHVCALDRPWDAQISVQTFSLNVSPKGFPEDISI